MELFTDYATPYELSLTARVGAEEAERDRVSLSSFLPNVPVPGTTINITQGENGLNDVAEYRAYDAETTFGSTPGGKRMTVELPPLGQQARVSEWDQLQMRNINNPELMATSQLRVAKRLGAAVADRLELARGQAIQAGGVSIDENKFFAEVDYGRSVDMNVTPGVLWSEAATATPLDDIQDWVQAYVDENGALPGSLIISTQALNALKKTDQLRSAATNGTVAQMINNQFVNEYLAGNGLPPLFVYDRKVRQGGQLVSVIDAGTIVFAPSSELQAGVTALGTTLESLDANYSIPAMEQSGIVVGAYKAHNPMGIYLNSAAIGLPVLSSANAFMAATVL